MYRLREQLAPLLTGLPLYWKRLIAGSGDLAVLVLAAYAVVALTRESLWIRAPDHLFLIFAAPLVTVATFAAMGVYSAMVRFVNIELLARLVRAVLVSTCVIGSILWLRDLLADLWTLLVLYGMSGSVAIVVERLAAAGLLRNSAQPSTDKVLIYGAGEAGRQLAAALVHSGQYRVVGFTDDRDELHHRQILGYRVYPPAELQAICRKLGIDRILLSIPSLPRQRRAEILKQLEGLAVRVMVMPGLKDLADGRASVSELREVQIEDLLGREPVDPDIQLLDACIRDQVVMITGAGGSIGSELCRQVVRRGVRALVLFEINELALYQIERDLQRELARSGGRVAIVPVLGNVGDREAVERALQEHGVTTVYHAAAYKHVPLVECNPFAGVANNVFGAQSVVEACMRHGVRNFVLVSSDKAVRPTNIMGATKRIQELIVQAAAAAAPTMRMSMVRFGNVLASSGSVVPLFREQICKGGPVTVTHPAITRFFMTIPEAAQLVIQAGALGQHGDLFVLDMGEPVRIVELAQRMIHLSGLEVRSTANPGGDIEVVFTGLRPGEKLYEELLIGDDTRLTCHPRIRLAREEFLGQEELAQALSALRGAVERRDRDILMTVLRQLVPGYRNGEAPATILAAPVPDVAPITVPADAGAAAPEPALPALIPALAGSSSLDTQRALS